MQIFIMKILGVALDTGICMVDMCGGYVWWICMVDMYGRYVWVGMYEYVRVVDVVVAAGHS